VSEDDSYSNFAGLSVDNFFLDWSFFFDLVGFGIDFGRFAGIGLLPVFIGIGGLPSFLTEFPFFVSVLEDFYFLPVFVFERASLFDCSIGL